MSVLLHLLMGLLIALFALAVLPAQAASDDTIGSVAKKRMDVYGIPPGDARVRIFPNDDIFFGERIETSGGAAVLIRMVDDTELFIGERANLVIDDFVYEPSSKVGKAVYTLGVGTLRFVSGDMMADDISIDTPNASIGLRGSEAIIFVTPQNETIVNVMEGSFSVRSRERPDLPGITVGKGENVSLQGGADFSPVGQGVRFPDYTHDPEAKVPDFSDDFYDLKDGGGLDRSREGQDAGTRTSESPSDSDGGHGGHPY